jgi:hypothetical protein
MRTWISKIFGTEEKPSAAEAAKAVSPKVEQPPETISDAAATEAGEDKRPLDNQPEVSKDPLKQLECELRGIGLQLKDAFSSSSTVGPDGDQRDNIHRTHRICRGEKILADVTILPWEQRAELGQLTEPETRELLEPVMQRCRLAAFGSSSPTGGPNSPLLLVRSGPQESADMSGFQGFPRGNTHQLLPHQCPSCKGHGGWGGLSEPFERCPKCLGTGVVRD